MVTQSGASPGQTTHPLRSSLLRLDYPMPERLVPKLRRFVNLFVGQRNDLFHNHQSARRYHYRYPLVQYKTVDGLAALIGLTDAGVAATQELAADPDFRTHCTEWLGPGSIWLEEHSDLLYLRPEADFSYRLSQYIALNEDNHRQWQQNPSLTARAALLERCLTGHILKFASALKWQLPPRSLEVCITDFRLRSARVFDTDMIAFDVLFRSNISLPDSVGLGKAVSHGFGKIQTL